MKKFVEIPTEELTWEDLEMVLDKDIVIVETFGNKERIMEECVKRLCEMDEEVDEGYAEDVLGDIISGREIKRYFFKLERLNKHKVGEIEEILEDITIDDFLNKKYNGMKIGKAIRKAILSGIPKQWKHVYERILSKELPQLTDYIYQGIGVVSNYPVDILYPNFGSFDTCFSRGGCYQSSVLNLLNNDFVWIMYAMVGTWDKSLKYNIYKRRERAYLFWQGDLWAGLTMYPSKDFIDLVGFMKRAYSKIMGVDGEGCTIYSEADYELTHMEKGLNRVIYYDGIQYIIHNETSLLECDFRLEPARCISCGSGLTLSAEHFICEECDYRTTCRDCGARVDEDMIAAYYDGEPICNSCYEENYRFCESCQGVYPIDDTVEVVDVNGHRYCLCNHCRSSQDIWYCESCEEYHDDTISKYIIHKHGRTFEACDYPGDCEVCENCGEVFEMEEMVLIKEDDCSWDLYYCQECVEELNLQEVSNG